MRREAHTCPTFGPKTDHDLTQQYEREVQQLNVLHIKSPPTHTII